VQKHDYDLIVRAHQVVEDGYEVRYYYFLFFIRMLFFDL